jgi:hypothetical protein
MRKWLIALVVVAALFSLPLALPRAEEAKKEEGPNLVHNVFFSLKENTPENRKKLVAACKKYLTKHNEVYFAVGPLCDELKREVNDRDFDICLTIVFKNKAAHDVYQDHKRHTDFIEENKALWKKVRVFDSYVD